MKLHFAETQDFFIFYRGINCGMIKKENSWNIRNEILKIYKKYIFQICICLVTVSILNFFQPLIIREITDKGMLEKNMKDIIVFSVLLLLTYTVMQGVDLIQTSLFVRVRNKLWGKLYDKVYQKLSRLPLTYYFEKDSAEIIGTIESDINSVSSVADEMTAFSVAAILQIVGGMAGLFMLNWKLAFLVVFLIPVKCVIVNILSKQKEKQISGMIENNRAFFAWMGDCISGIREMKLWNLFFIKQKQFEQLQKKMMCSYKDNMLLDQWRVFLIAVSDMLLHAGLYILSGAMIIQGEFTIGGAFAFLSYSGDVTSPITSLISIRYYFAQILPSARRLVDFLELEEEYVQTEDRVETKQESAAILEFSDVWFGYNQEEMILKGIHFQADKGDKIAIIGDNGSGKSTILDLAAGFYRPNAGVIRIQGVPLNQMGAWEIRSKISVVSQKSYLFQGTVEENINIGEDALETEVIDVCHKSGVCCSNLKETIGHDGAALSGGEHQKIALARALLKKADILFLDEANASLDVGADAILCDLLKNNINHKTVIFVTHRQELLQAADKIYRLKNGKLIQEK